MDDNREPYRRGSGHSRSHTYDISTSPRAQFYGGPLRDSRDAYRRPNYERGFTSPLGRTGTYSGTLGPVSPDRDRPTTSYSPDHDRRAYSPEKVLDRDRAPRYHMAERSNGYRPRDDGYRGDAYGYRGEDSRPPGRSRDPSPEHHHGFYHGNHEQLRERASDMDPQPRPTSREGTPLDGWATDRGSKTPLLPFMPPHVHGSSRGGEYRGGSIGAPGIGDSLGGAAAERQGHICSGPSPNGDLEAGEVAPGPAAASGSRRNCSPSSFLALPLRCPSPDQYSSYHPSTRHHYSSYQGHHSQPALHHAPHRMQSNTVLSSRVSLSGAKGGGVHPGPGPPLEPPSQGADLKVGPLLRGSGRDGSREFSECEGRDGGAWAARDGDGRNARANPKATTYRHSPRSGGHGLQAGRRDGPSHSDAGEDKDWPPSAKGWDRDREHDSERDREQERELNMSAHGISPSAGPVGQAGVILSPPGQSPRRVSADGAGDGVSAAAVTAGRTAAGDYTTNASDHGRADLSERKLPAPVLQPHGVNNIGNTGGGVTAEVVRRVSDGMADSERRYGPKAVGLGPGDWTLGFQSVANSCQNLQAVEPDAYPLGRLSAAGISVPAPVPQAPDGQAARGLALEQLPELSPAPGFNQAKWKDAEVTPVSAADLQNIAPALAVLPPQPQASRRGSTSGGAGGSGALECSAKHGDAASMRLVASVDSIAAPTPQTTGEPEPGELLDGAELLAPPLAPELAQRPPLPLSAEVQCGPLQPSPSVSMDVDPPTPDHPLQPTVAACATVSAQQLKEAFAIASGLGNFGRFLSARQEVSGDDADSAGAASVATVQANSLLTGLGREAPASAPATVQAMTEPMPEAAGRISEGALLASTALQGATGCTISASTGYGGSDDGLLPERKSSLSIRRFGFGRARRSMPVKSAGEAVPEEGELPTATNAGGVQERTPPLFGHAELTGGEAAATGKESALPPPLPTAATADVVAAAPFSRAGAAPATAAAAALSNSGDVARKTTLTSFPSTGVTVLDHAGAPTMMVTEVPLCTAAPLPTPLISTPAPTPWWTSTPPTVSVAALNLPADGAYPGDVCTPQHSGPSGDEAPGAAVSSVSNAGGTAPSSDVVNQPVFDIVACPVANAVAVAFVPSGSGTAAGGGKDSVLIEADSQAIQEHGVTVQRQPTLMPHVPAAGEAAETVAALSLRIEHLEAEITEYERHLATLVMGARRAQGEVSELDAEVGALDEQLLADPSASDVEVQDDDKSDDDGEHSADDGDGGTIGVSKGAGACVVAAAVAGGGITCDYPLGKGADSGGEVYRNGGLCTSASGADAIIAAAPAALSAAYPPSETVKHFLASTGPAVPLAAAITGTVRGATTVRVRDSGEAMAAATTVLVPSSLAMLPVAPTIKSRGRPRSTAKMRAAEAAAAAAVAAGNRRKVLEQQARVPPDGVLHLPAGQFEPRLLDTARRAVSAAREEVLRLLPEDLTARARLEFEAAAAQQARLAGSAPSPGNGRWAVVVPLIAMRLKLLYREPQDISAFHDNARRHALVRDAVGRYLLQRRQLVAAKQDVLVSEYGRNMAAYKLHIQDACRPLVLPPAMPTGCGSVAGAIYSSAYGVCGSSHQQHPDPHHAAVSSSRGGVMVSSYNHYAYSHSDVIRSDLDEQRLLNSFAAVEQLKRMCVLPDMVLDPWERRWRTYDNRNGLVLDPVREIDEERIIKAWAEEERSLFMDKFLQHPKDFRRISSYLPSRSQGDCVAFFYKNQKLDDFGTVRRKQQLKKRRLQADMRKQQYAPLLMAPIARQRGLGPGGIISADSSGAGVRGGARGRAGTRGGGPGRGRSGAYPDLDTAFGSIVGHSYGGQLYGAGGGFAGVSGPRGRGSTMLDSDTALHGIPMLPSYGSPPFGGDGDVGGPQPPMPSAGVMLPMAGAPCGLPSFQTMMAAAAAQPDFAATACSSCRIDGMPLTTAASPLLSPIGSSFAAVATAAVASAQATYPHTAAGISGGGGPLVAGWTDDDFIECYRQHGRCWEAYCRMLGMKTESAAKQYYYQHRERLGLDRIVIAGGSAAMGFGGGGLDDGGGIQNRKIFLAGAGTSVRDPSSAPPVFLSSASQAGVAAAAAADTILPKGTGAAPPPPPPNLVNDVSHAFLPPGQTVQALDVAQAPNLANLQQSQRVLFIPKGTGGRRRGGLLRPTMATVSVANGPHFSAASRESWKMIGNDNDNATCKSDLGADVRSDSDYDMTAEARSGAPHGDVCDANAAGAASGGTAGLTSQVDLSAARRNPPGKPLSQLLAGGLLQGAAGSGGDNSFCKVGGIAAGTGCGGGNGKLMDVLRDLLQQQRPLQWDPQMGDLPQSQVHGRGGGSEQLSPMGLNLGVLGGLAGLLHGGGMAHEGQPTGPQTDDLSGPLSPGGDDGMAAPESGGGGSGAGNLGRRGASFWSEEEKNKFYRIFLVHGRDWARLAEAIPTKTTSQIKTYYHNYKAKLGLDKIGLSSAAVQSGSRRWGGGGGQGRAAREPASSGGCGGEDGVRPPKRQAIGGPPLRGSGLLDLGAGDMVAAEVMPPWAGGGDGSGVGMADGNGGASIPPPQPQQPQLYHRERKRDTQGPGAAASGASGLIGLSSRGASSTAQLLALLSSLSDIPGLPSPGGSADGQGLPDGDADEALGLTRVALNGPSRLMRLHGLHLSEHDNAAGIGSTIGEHAGGIFVGSNLMASHEQHNQQPVNMQALNLKPCSASTLLPPSLDRERDPDGGSGPDGAISSPQAGHLPGAQPHGVVAHGVVAHGGTLLVRDAGGGDAGSLAGPLLSQQLQLQALAGVLGAGDRDCERERGGTRHLRDRGGDGGPGAGHQGKPNQESLRATIIDLLANHHHHQQQHEQQQEEQQEQEQRHVSIGGKQLALDLAGPPSSITASGSKTLSLGVLPAAGAGPTAGAAPAGPLAALVDAVGATAGAGSSEATPPGCARPGNDSKVGGNSGGTGFGISSSLGLSLQVVIPRNIHSGDRADPLALDAGLGSGSGSWCGGGGGGEPAPKRQKRPSRDVSQRPQPPQQEQEQPGLDLGAPLPNASVPPSLAVDRDQHQSATKQLFMRLQQHHGATASAPTAALGSGSDCGGEGLRQVLAHEVVQHQRGNREREVQVGCAVGGVGAPPVQTLNHGQLEGLQLLAGGVARSGTSAIGGGASGSTQNVLRLVPLQPAAAVVDQQQHQHGADVLPGAGGGGSDVARLPAGGNPLSLPVAVGQDSRGHGISVTDLLSSLQGPRCLIFQARACGNGGNSSGGTGGYGVGVASSLERVLVGSSGQGAVAGSGTHYVTLQPSIHGGGGSSDISGVSGWLGPGLGDHLAGPGQRTVLGLGRPGLLWPQQQERQQSGDQQGAER